MTFFRLCQELSLLFEAGRKRGILKPNVCVAVPERLTVFMLEGKQLILF